MAWTIPVGEVAGLLAVTFTGGPAETAPPVQRPSTTAPADPADPTGRSVDPAAGAADPTAPVDPGGPTPPTLPPADGSDSAIPDPPSAAPTLDAPAMAPMAAPPMDPSAAGVAAPALDDEVPGSAPPAASERLLRPTDKRRFFQMSAGGATNSGYYSYLGGPMSFQFEGVIGSHSQRRPQIGGGFVVQYRQGIGSEVSLAGRFQWDKALSKSFSIYSSFDATLGVAVAIPVGVINLPTRAAGQVGIGWGVKAILADRFMLFVRPIAPNLVAPSYSALYVQLRWDVGGGLGFVW